jgi:hypothetical protein
MQFKKIHPSQIDQISAQVEENWKLLAATGSY